MVSHDCTLVVILSCVHINANDRWKCGQAPHHCGVIFESKESFDPLVFHPIHAFKCLVSEPVLTDALPYVLDRVEFRTVRRKENQVHVRRHRQLFSLVPARSIHDHEDELFRVTSADLAKKRRHGRCIYLGQDQRIHYPVMRGQCRISIGVLAHDLAWHVGANSSGSPAAPWTADSPKPSLILKHQPKSAPNTGNCVSASSHQSLKFF